MTPTTREELIETVARALAGYGPGQDGWHYALAQATAALTALEEVGCVVVPVEATEEMVMAWSDKAAFFREPGSGPDHPPRVYTTMLASSPYRKGE